MWSLSVFFQVQIHNGHGLDKISPVPRVGECSRITSASASAVVDTLNLNTSVLINELTRMHKWILRRESLRPRLSKKVFIQWDFI